MNTDRYEELYEEHILPHFEDPYHKGLLPVATCQNSGRNPLCGDEVTLQLTIDENGRIKEAHFDGNGCAISQAGASILCEQIEGKSVEEVENLTAEEMLELIGVPLTATRQRCGLLSFKILKTLLYSRDGETAAVDS